MITNLSGKKVSPLGIGTWGTGGWMFADKSEDQRQVASLNFALDNGINAIDTAELYGKGHAEELVAQAINGRDRDSLHITSKVWPTHFSRKGILNSVNKSLERLQTRYIDLYLFHFPNPLANMKECIATMEELVDLGKIGSFGVSNFSVNDVRKAMEATKKCKIEANQIKYSLLHKDSEAALIPFCEKNGIKVIAHTPLAKGKIADSGPIMQVAQRCNKTPVQVALNYLMKRSYPIPKASNIEHLKEILGASGWELDEKEYETLRRFRG